MKRDEKKIFKERVGGRVKGRERKRTQNNVHETTVKFLKLIKNLILITYACEHEQRIITIKASLLDSICDAY